MKRGIFFLELFVFLAITVAASMMPISGDMDRQVQRKALQQKKTLMVQSPSVTSVTPQKAVLTQDGNAVVVQANGANLGVINSAQVMRAGKAAAEIEATLDKSQLPATLKVSLRALATARIASDYQLAVFDAGNNKLLDVPTTLLAIEVVAAVQKAATVQKTTTTTKTSEPVQRQVQTQAAASAVKPSVASISPQKAVLTQGGEAVVITARGANLTAVGSVQVIRAGVEAQAIEESLDKSQLPAALKVSLKASAKAPIANDFQLSVFDAGGQKLLDVPIAVLAIEVVAAGTRTFAPSRTPQQPVTRQREERAQASQVQGPIKAQPRYVQRPSNPAPMRWSAVSMENPDPARPHFPTLSTVQLPPENIDFRNDQLKFVTRPAIPFTEFKMKDPKTGEAISPDTLISTPFHKNMIRAQDYYDELNWLEANLNSMGYSLDKGQDPIEKVHLSVSEAPTGHPLKKMDWRDYRNERATSQQKFMKKVEDTKFFAQSGKTPSASAKFQAKVVEYNKPTAFSKTLVGTAFREANWLIGADETCNADLSADIDKMQIKSTWGIQGSILGNWFWIVRVNSDTSSPISNGQAIANCTANIVGHELSWTGSHDDKVSVPEKSVKEMSTMPGGIPSISIVGNGVLNEPVASYSWVIMVGYVPVTIRVAANANVGAFFAGTSGPTGIFNDLEPYGATDLSIMAAVDLYLVAAGARGRLNLISSFPQINCSIAREFTGGEAAEPQDQPKQRSQPSLPPSIITSHATHSIIYDYSIYRQLSSLSGDISFVLIFSYPCWKDYYPGLCTKEYSYVIGSWPGIVHGEFLVPPASGSQDLAYYPLGQIPGYNN